jgi:hypothetical protein
MRFHRTGKVLVVALAMCAGRASAFLELPYIAPANPTAGEMISVNINGGVCDAIIGLPGYPQITQQGNDIHILFFSVHFDNLELCNLGIGTATTSIGAFPAGSYTLEVERRYMTVFATWHQETLGLIPFTVSGGPPSQPVEAPTLGIPGLGSLWLALIVVALLALRPRRA